MTTARRLALAALAHVLAVAALPGCSQKSGPAPQSGALVPVDLSNHPSMDPLPDPDQNGGHVGRAPRRLTVAQLKQSIQVTTGRQWSQIDALSASLGKADFAITNAEAVEPNLVFAKFLEDGAREVCLSAAKADLTAAAADRVLTSELPAGVTDYTTLDATAVQKNLAMLSVRFWGQPMSDAEKTDWAASFATLAARAKTVKKPEQAWGAICIGLMTDPRFFTY